MSLETIVNAVATERAYQNLKWGEAFDNKNTVNDWVAYINIYAAKATDMAATKPVQRSAMLKVAALAVAALEAFDRNEGFPPRHYDKS